MSCSGNTRNRDFGILLGKGYSTEEAIAEMRKGNKTLEGINTLKGMKKLTAGSEVDFRQLHAVNEIVFQGKDAMGGYVLLHKLT